MTPVKILAVNRTFYSLPNNHFKGLRFYCSNSYFKMSFKAGNVFLVNTKYVYGELRHKGIWHDSFDHKPCFIYQRSWKPCNFFQISDSSYDVHQHEVEEENDQTKSRWKKVMEHTVFPAIKKYLKPPKECADNRTFNMVADLPELYKVFERC
mgnify:CR=1 FL=1